MRRFRITWLMAVIAITAFEFGAIRALSGMSFRAYINGYPLLSRIIGALILGAIPMANILAVGLLISLRRSGSRPFLLGFEIFGAIALALYIAGVGLFSDVFVKFIYGMIIGQLVPYVRNGPYMNTVGVLIMYVITIVALAFPQLALALIGGCLFRKLRGERIPPAG